MRISFIRQYASMCYRQVEHYKTPPAAPSTAMYSRPRCACLACSDFSQPATADTVASLYQQPTTTAWRNNDDDAYYNSNEVDIDQLRLRRGCSCIGAHARSTAVSMNVAGRQGPPLLHANPLTTCMCLFCRCGMTRLAFTYHCLVNYSA